MNSYNRPAWRLPSGVTRGLWDYVHRDHIADDYDGYFAYNRLFEFDEQILKDHFVKPGAWVADLGCGTGRALVPLARLGLQGLAIDLSEPMLRIVQEKAELENLPITCLRCNLVEMDALVDGGVDYAMCMFSTLGMVRGGANRQTVMNNVFRILKPGGLFILHVHNRYYNLYDPGGPRWLLQNFYQSLVDPEVERGDKWFQYRGVPNMYLHVFTRRELTRLITGAGLRIQQMVLLDHSRMRALRRPWMFGQLRANGYIVICQRPLET
ncbi:class I SAM-dependent methyltransferase [Lignipirellula cremea]|uniref:Demethylmenaquinone methyltransferase n=1 Tax=Lignipirellula cremea TaxID=2528010 RepID=A0A518E4Y9_9BACT|nr:class I SAM-dependent methyltransferase [Lignipirellula cremea]QDU99144.1 Demethylmenaquinone methyltransferase [Lignipirellula cremea]